MAPLSIDLDLYRKEIADLLFSGKKISDLVKYLKDTYCYGSTS